MAEQIINSGHVDELLSGFIDEELTQQETQRVRIHVEQCTKCAQELDDIRSLRQNIGAARLSNLNQNTWREAMDDKTVRTSRGLGWLLLIGGALIAGFAALVEGFASVASLSLTEKLILGGVYGGLLLIFISVLRQRLIERKKDRYKDVEI